MSRRPRQMWLIRLLIVLLILSLTLPLVLARCSGCEKRADVAIWHSFPADSDEDQLLKGVLGQIASESPSISLEVTALGDDLGNALAEGVSLGELPDIIIAPAEWAPTLDRAQLLYRVPLETEDDWLAAVTASLARDGQLLGLPAFCSTIALGRTQRLSAQPWPESVSGLASSAAGAANAGHGMLYWPVGDAYYALPWFLSAGGRLEPAALPGQNPPWDDPSEVDVAAARSWLADVGRLAQAVDGERRTFAPLDSWRDGSVAYAPMTPQEWVLIRAASVAADLGALPGGLPFLSTWVAMLPRTESETEANGKAVELLVRFRTNDDDGLLYLASSMGMLPVLAKHYQSEVMTASGLSAFKPIAEDALAMPAGRFAAEVWAAYELALSEFLAGAKAEDVVNRLKVGVATQTGGAP